MHKIRGCLCIRVPAFLPSCFRNPVYGAAEARQALWLEIFLTGWRRPGIENRSDA
ncbi:MAG: hypothetical protein K2P69_03400 [Eubacterium sp.]|nr:hypothetical protein [Eubacterium sp.]